MTVSVYIFILIQLVYVAYQDYKTKKILNVWTLSNLTFAFIFYFIYPHQYQFSMNVIYTFLIVFFIGFVLYCKNIMGAGDVKYLSSFFLLIPEKMHHVFIEMLIFSTIIIGLTLILKQLYFIFIKKKKVEFMGSKFSYAPVIFFSWLGVGWKMLKH